LPKDDDMDEHKRVATGPPTGPPTAYGIAAVVSFVGKMSKTISEGN
jgi:hypothetical protein